MREAYGAASLGACTGRMPLEDQIKVDDIAENDREDIGSTYDTCINILIIKYLI